MIRTPRAIRTTSFRAVALAALLAPALAAAASLEPVETPALYHLLWLEEVAPWISEDEVVQYQALETEADRDLWRRDFWRRRDPAPDLSFHPLKERYANHLRAVRRYGFLPSEPRGELLLRHGPPSRAIGSECNTAEDAMPSSPLIQTASCIAAPPHQMFDFGAGASIGEAPVLFVSESGRCELYDDETRFIFRTTNPTACGRGQPWSIPGRLRAAMKAALTWDEIAERGIDLPPVRDPQDLPTLPPALRDAPRLEVMAFEEPERRDPEDLSMIVRATLELPIAEAWWSTPLPWRVIQQRTDIFLDGLLLFQADAATTVAADPGRRLRLPWDLRLPPGTYDLVLHVEDEQPHLYSTATFRLEVPNAPGTLEVEVERPEVVALPVVQLKPLDGLLAGLVDVELEQIAGEVTEVVYRLDGAEVARTSRSPYSIRIDLGKLPIERRLEVVALGPDGQRLARDALTLNRDLHGFALDIVDGSDLAFGDVHVSVRAAVPKGRRLESLAIFEGDREVARGSDPRLDYRRRSQPGEFDRGGATLVRAQARLDDGTEREETLLLSANASESVDVQLVEVFAGVTTRGGRAILDLDASDFRILENGQPQTLRSFRKVEELPLHVALLLDTSSTMTEEMSALRSAARNFLDQVLREDDRATLIPFNHRAYVAVPFTNDDVLLDQAVASLTSWGGTGLLASSVLSLHYLRGTSGKRALILVSDGVDQDSSLSYDDLLEYATRVDAAVYTIGLGVPQIGADDREEALRLLRGLAQRTGGRFFPIKSQTALAEVLETIETDLRTQYLLTYEATPSADPGFRTIEVDVTRRGARVQSKPGYYP